MHRARSGNRKGTMMDVEIFYAALGGCVATMALMLAVLRFSSRTAQIPVLSVLARWRKIRGVKALAPVVALIAMAAACFSNALGRTTMPVGSSAKLEASAVAAFSEAPGAAAEQDVAAGGRAIRVVLVDEPTGWVAFLCTDPGASAAEVLGASPAGSRWKRPSEIARTSSGRVSNRSAG